VHFRTLINRLCRDGRAFVEMDEARLTTTSWRVVAQKSVV
jgi:sterol 24-C-methyltransferase